MPMHTTVLVEVTILVEINPFTELIVPVFGQVHSVAITVSYLQHRISEQLLPSLAHESDELVELQLLSVELATV